MNDIATRDVAMMQKTLNKRNHMNLTHLTYRLKGSPEIYRRSFDTFDAANQFLVENHLQYVVGNLAGVEKPWEIIELAAKKSKADWFEFTHEVIQ
jgi:hypothetical protein